MTDALTQEQIDECREAFNMFDKNGDDTISIGELGAVMRSLDLTPKDADLKDMVEAADKNGNGTIEYQEFLSMMTQFLKAPDIEVVLRDAFSVFDKDGNGLISATEVHTVMEKLGQNMTDDEVEQMIKGADVDGDGHVNYPEFVRLMVSKK